MQFSELGLSPKLVSAVQAAGYTEATPVQAQAIPAALKGGDLLVSASTGSGKTAAFLLPSLERMMETNNGSPSNRVAMDGPRVLVLAPTRELAMQVAKAAQTYGRDMKRLKVATVVGGVPYGLQIKALAGPLDILIATPGRLLDLMQMRKANLSNVEVLVLDEADRMLDMGFIDDIEAIAAVTPPKRQTLLFSATFDGDAGRLAQKLTQKAERIEVNSQTEKHDNITQRMHWADNSKHKDALLDHLLADVDLQQAIVFTSTQRDAEKLAFRLEDIGHKVAALHGGMPQGKRNRTLQQLREGRVRVLIATDVAARGLDVRTISHVINYGMPMNPEDYVHRIGRTGRAGRDGMAITLAQADDNSMVRRIERLTTQRIPNEVIPGLEPKMATPSERAGRAPSRSFGAKPGRGKPAPRRDGYASQNGNDRGFQGRSDAGRGDSQGFAARKPAYAGKTAGAGNFGGNRSFGENRGSTGFAGNGAGAARPERSHFSDPNNAERTRAPRERTAGQFAGKTNDKFGDRGNRSGFGAKPAPAGRGNRGSGFVL